jgi:MCP family monocarboxylic acid transporter-like MFS transporter 10
MCSLWNIYIVICSFTSAAYVSAFHIPLFAMGAIEDVGRRVGTVFVFAAVGSLLGPPISGAINAATGSTKDMSYYAGNIIP